MFDISKVKKTKWNKELLKILGLYENNTYWKNYIQSKINFFIHNSKDQKQQIKNRMIILNIIINNGYYRRSHAVEQLNYTYSISLTEIRKICHYLCHREMPKNLYKIEYDSMGDSIEEITI